jgi:SAM-dependent methyltransferase
MGKSGISKTDYSKIAKYYDRFRMRDVDYWLSRIIEYGKIETNCAVLDVGCGTGRFPLGMSVAKNCFLYALDPSIEMLKQAVAKDKSKRILWIRGDGQRLPFRDSVFDCVYMTLVIHHIEDKELALQEIHRVLKKKGKCVIMTSSHARIKKHILRYFPGVLAIDLKRFPTVPSLKNMMKMVSFKDVHYHILKYNRGYMSTNEYLKRVKNKYVSTLTLLSEDSFSKRIQDLSEES